MLLPRMEHLRMVTMNSKSLVLLWLSLLVALGVRHAHVLEATVFTFNSSGDTGPFATSSMTFGVCNMTLYSGKWFFNGPVVFMFYFAGSLCIWLVIPASIPVFVNHLLTWIRHHLGC